MQYGEQFVDDATANAEDAIARRADAGESTKAWAAFKCYLNLPPGKRSLSAAYRAYRGETGAGQGQDGGAEEPKSAPSHFENWSSEWDWVERCDRYDHAQSQLQRAALHEQQKATIEAFQNRAKRIADTKTAVYYRFVNIVNRRLNDCEQQDAMYAEQRERLRAEAERAGQDGRTFKPTERPILPTPIAEYEAIARTFARASVVVDSGLSAEGFVIEVRALLRELATERKQAEQE